MQKNLLIIHGLNQSKFAFRKMISEFEKDYTIHYFSYSNKETIPEIVERLHEFLKERGVSEYSAVTMSFGAIIIRNYFAMYSVQGVDRVVMIGPPNQGSALLRSATLDWKWRPLLGRLIKDYLDHEREYLPSSPSFDAGIIAGTKAMISKPPVPLSYINRFFDTTNSDGKVKIEETKLSFMKDFVTVDECHDSMLSNPEVIMYSRQFLNKGSFQSAD